MPALAFSQSWGRSMDSLANNLSNELRLLWAAHGRAGLDGKMCLYSIESDRPWPAKDCGLKFWFGRDEVDAAVATFLQHYNNGTFPYTPLLLNPIVHRVEADGSHTPLGSGVYWATALTITNVGPDKMERIAGTGAAGGYVLRAETQKSGIKILGFSETVVPLAAENSVSGCRQFYDLTDIKGDEYWPYYLLGGVSYLSNAGNYVTPDFATLFGDSMLVGRVSDEALAQIVSAHTLPLQRIEEAAICWERYDRHPILYGRFGNDVAKLDENLKFYYYCARDFELFDKIGPNSMNSESKKESFEFLVEGLIPRGSIVLLAGTGGTGKSSLAHQLCCLAATDWNEDEDPRWIGLRVNKRAAKGICVYFSGEDGPAIINARNELFDPNKRSQRLMFQRTNFRDKNGDELNFAQFLGRLRTMPEVPLLVVDPARKYLSGDEEDSAVVSEFFEAIEQFAHERNTSVIVVHHLSKGAKPGSAREVLDELRGSQVFIDRPRVVIGMFREGPKTIIGLAKCNIPPSLGMEIRERVFAHNPKTLELTQIPGPAGVRDEYQAPDEE